MLDRKQNILKQVLQEKNISIRGLSRLTGIPAGTLSSIALHKYEPSLKFCQKIAHALNLQTEDIFGIANNNSEFENDKLEVNSHSKEIIYKQDSINKQQSGKVQIKLFENSLTEDYECYFLNKETLSLFDYHTNKQINKLIGFYMYDNSMKDTIRKHDILIVDTSLTTIQNNKVYAFSQNNNFYIRMLYKEKENIKAMPFNGKEDIFTVKAKDITICGKVVIVMPSSQPFKL